MAGWARYPGTVDLPLKPVDNAPATPVELASETADRDDAMVGELMSLVPKAVRLAMVMGLSADEAADAVQDATIQAWRRRAQLRGPLMPWFLTIVRRRALRTRRWVTFPSFWRPGLPGSQGREPAWSSEMVAALATLPARQRAALWLRYGLDMSTADVARVLGTSEGSVKQLLLRARAGARARLHLEAGR